jgi:hypothetical protein
MLIEFVHYPEINSKLKKKAMPVHYPSFIYCMSLFGRLGFQAFVHGSSITPHRDIKIIRRRSDQIMPMNPR